MGRHPAQPPPAFKNDIAFWRSRKSMEGLSANNVVAELGCQVVLTLYLFHNEAGWPILLPMAVGLGRAERPLPSRSSSSCFVMIGHGSLTGPNPLFWNADLPERWCGFHLSVLRLVIQVWKAGIAVRLKAQGKDSSTAQADAQAMRWLSYVLYPLVVGYAGYSLLYKEHKGWYGWGLESLASAVYAFGFALMTPQLYINYKLKSVANLPWRVFLYRACNTFIDDLFAFIIKMPTLHRLSAFRDDLIFVIYLFQRWQYPVDPTRHEGFEGEEVKGSHEVRHAEEPAKLTQKRE